MTRIRPLAGIAAGLAALLGVAGCGGLGSTSTAQTSTSAIPELSPNQQVSITFESYNYGSAGAWMDSFNTLRAGFEKQYPNITLTGQKPEGNSPNPAVDSVTSVQSELAAGNPPDVAQLTFDALPFAADSLAAHPLDSLVGASAVQANFGGAHPFAPSATTLGDYKGHTYGMPFVLSTPVLYYNSSLFQRAGLDPNNPPKTWAEVQQDALTIKAKTGKDGSYIDCLTKQSGSWCLDSLLRSNGGRFLSPDLTKLAFGDAPAVQAVQTFQTMVKNGASPNLTQLQAVTEFNTGGLGMLLESSSLQGTFLKASTGAHWTLAAAAEPSFGSTPAIPTNSGAALFIFAKDPAKQRAAWDLIKYLTSDQAYDLISSKVGYLPLRTGLVDSPTDLQPWAKANPLINVNLGQLPRVQSWEAFPGNNYLQITNTMLDAVDKVVYQGADPQSTLGAAQSQASALLPK